MIVNEADYEDYLAHFGVKGMRWGHRKPGEGHETAKKVAKTAAATAVVIGGAAASAYVLKKYGAKKAIEVGMKSFQKAKMIQGVANTVKSDYGYKKPEKVPAQAMSMRVDALHIESMQKYHPPGRLQPDDIARRMKDPTFMPTRRDALP